MTWLEYEYAVYYAQLSRQQSLEGPRRIAWVIASALDSKAPSEAEYWPLPLLDPAPKTVKAPETGPETWKRLQEKGLI